MTFSNLNVFRNTVNTLNTSAGHRIAEPVRSGGSFSPNTFESVTLMRADLDNSWDNSYITKYQATIQNRLNKLKQELTDAYKSLLETSSAQQITETDMTASTSAATDVYGNLILGNISGTASITKSDPLTKTLYPPDSKVLRPSKTTIGEDAALPQTTTATSAALTTTVATDPVGYARTATDKDIFVADAVAAGIKPGSILKIGSATYTVDASYITGSDKVTLTTAVPTALTGTVTNLSSVKLDKVTDLTTATGTLVETDIVPGSILKIGSDTTPYTVSSVDSATNTVSFITSGTGAPASFPASYSGAVTVTNPVLTVKVKDDATDTTDANATGAGLIARSNISIGGVAYKVSNFLQPTVTNAVTWPATALPKATSPNPPLPPTAATDTSFTVVDAATAGLRAGSVFEIGGISYTVDSSYDSVSHVNNIPVFQTAKQSAFLIDATTIGSTTNPATAAKITLNKGGAAASDIVAGSILNIGGRIVKVGSVDTSYTTNPNSDVITLTADTGRTEFPPLTVPSSDQVGAIVTSGTIVRNLKVGAVISEGTVINNLTPALSSAVQVSYNAGDKFVTLLPGGAVEAKLASGDSISIGGKIFTVDEFNAATGTKVKTGITTATPTTPVNTIQLDDVSSIVAPVGTTPGSTIQINGVNYKVGTVTPDSSPPAGTHPGTVTFSPPITANIQQGVDVSVLNPYLNTQTNPDKVPLTPDPSTILTTTTTVTASSSSKATAPSGAASGATSITLGTGQASTAGIQAGDSITISDLKWTSTTTSVNSTTSTTNNKTTSTIGNTTAISTSNTSTAPGINDVAHGSGTIAALAGATSIIVGDAAGAGIVTGDSVSIGTDVRTVTVSGNTLTFSGGLSADVAANAVVTNRSLTSINVADAAGAGIATGDSVSIDGQVRTVTVSGNTLSFSGALTSAISSNSPVVLNLKTSITVADAAAAGIVTGDSVSIGTIFSPTTISSAITQAMITAGPVTSVTVADAAAAGIVTGSNVSIDGQIRTVTSVSGTGNNTLHFSGGLTAPVGANANVANLDTSQVRTVTVSGNTLTFSGPLLPIAANAVVLNRSIGSINVANAAAAGISTGSIVSIDGQPSGIITTTTSSTIAPSGALVNATSIVVANAAAAGIVTGNSVSIDGQIRTVTLIDGPGNNTLHFSALTADVPSNALVTNHSLTSITVNDAAIAGISNGSIIDVGGQIRKVTSVSTGTGTSPTRGDVITFTTPLSDYPAAGAVVKNRTDLREVTVSSNTLTFSPDLTGPLIAGGAVTNVALTSITLPHGGAAAAGIVDTSNVLIPGTIIDIGGLQSKTVTSVTIGAGTAGDVINFAEPLTGPIPTGSVVVTNTNHASIPAGGADNTITVTVAPSYVAGSDNVAFTTSLPTAVSANAVVTNNSKSVTSVALADVSNITVGISTISVGGELRKITGVVHGIGTAGTVSFVKPLTSDVTAADNTDPLNPIPAENVYVTNPFLDLNEVVNLSKVKVADPTGIQVKNTTFVESSTTVPAAIAGHATSITLASGGAAAAHIIVGSHIDISGQNKVVTSVVGDVISLDAELTAIAAGAHVTNMGGGSTSITVAGAVAADIAKGDVISINGQLRKITDVAGNVVSFAQPLAFDVPDSSIVRNLDKTSRIAFGSYPDMNLLVTKVDGDVISYVYTTLNDNNTTDDISDDVMGFTNTFTTTGGVILPQINPYDETVTVRNPYKGQDLVPISPAPLPAAFPDMVTQKPVYNLNSVSLHDIRGLNIGDTITVGGGTPLVISNISTEGYGTDTHNGEILDTDGTIKEINGVVTFSPPLTSTPVSNSSVVHKVYPVIPGATFSIITLANVTDLEVGDVIVIPGQPTSPLTKITAIDHATNRVSFEPPLTSAVGGGTDISLPSAGIVVGTGTKFLKDFAEYFIDPLNPSKGLREPKPKIKINDTNEYAVISSIQDDTHLKLEPIVFATDSTTISKPDHSEAFRGLNFYNDQASFNAADTIDGTAADGVPSYYVPDILTQYDANGKAINTKAGSYEMRKLYVAGPALQIVNDMKVTLRTEEVPPKKITSSLDFLGLGAAPFVAGEKVAEYSTEVKTGGYWSAINYLYNFAPREMKYDYITAYSTTSEESGTRLDANGKQETLFDGFATDARDSEKTTEDAVIGPYGNGQDYPMPKAGARIKWDSSDPSAGYTTEKSAVFSTVNNTGVEIQNLDDRLITRRTVDNDTEFNSLRTKFNSAGDDVRTAWDGFQQAYDSSGNPIAGGQVGNKQVQYGSEELGSGDFQDRIKWEYAHDGAGAADLNQDGVVTATSEYVLRDLAFGYPNSITPAQYAALDIVEKALYKAKDGDFHTAKAAYINHYIVATQSVEMNSGSQSWGTVQADDNLDEQGNIITKRAGLIRSAGIDGTADAVFNDIQTEDSGIIAGYNINSLGSAANLISNIPSSVSVSEYAALDGLHKSYYDSYNGKKVNRDGNGNIVIDQRPAGGDLNGDGAVNEKLLLAGSGKISKSFDGTYVSRQYQIKSFNGQDIATNSSNVTISALNASDPVVLGEYEGFARAASMSAGVAHDDYAKAGATIRTKDQAIALAKKYQTEINATKMADTDWHYADYVNSDKDQIMFKNVTSVSYIEGGITGTIPVQFDPTLRDHTGPTDLPEDSTFDKVTVAFRKTFHLNGLDFEKAEYTDPSDPNFYVTTPTLSSKDTFVKLAVTGAAATTVTAKLSSTSVSVVSTDGISAGDIITIGGQDLKVATVDAGTKIITFDTTPITVKVGAGSVVGVNNLTGGDLIVNGLKLTGVPGADLGNGVFNLKNYLREGDNVMAYQTKFGGGGGESFKLESAGTGDFTGSTTTAASAAGTTQGTTPGSIVPGATSITLVSGGAAAAGIVAPVGTTPGSIINIAGQIRRVTAVSGDIISFAGQPLNTPVAANAVVKLAGKNETGIDKWISAKISTVRDKTGDAALNELNDSLSDTHMSSWQSKIMVQKAATEADYEGIGSILTTTKVKDTNALARIITQIMNKPEYRDIFNLGLLNFGNGHGMVIKAQVSAPSGGNMSSTIEVRYDAVNQKFIVVQTKFEATG